MLQHGSTWFLIADGRRARVLVEPRRGARLEERGDLNMEIDAEEVYEPHNGAPRSFDRVGAGRHAMNKDRNLNDREERNFLRRVAKRVSEANAQKQFQHLVIAAPPRALGDLRTLLSDAAQTRIRAETAKDLLDEPEPRLRERLGELLAS